MSFTYLQEQGEESSAASFADIPAFVLSRLNLTHENSYSNANETESCQSSQSGTTCKPSTATRGEEKLMSSAADSHAKIFPPQEKELGSKENNLDYGPRWPGSFTRFDPVTYSWRTRQISFLEDLESFWGTWPRWGMMRDGECWERTMPAHLTSVKGSGYLPTPSGTSNHGKNHVCGRLDEWGGSSNPWRGTEIGKIACASFEEWVMGWPVMWTGLMPYETAKFQQWQHSHGIPSPIHEKPLAKREG
jgi:hypothetical protein